MEKVKLELDDQGEGAFRVGVGTPPLGEMIVGISGGTLTVHHTEVSPEAQGKGLAKMLLDAMVEHARANHLRVVPLCPYVYAQFKRRPEAYADLWTREK